MAKIALYLAGGGARGAYQAGVLKAISHILQVLSPEDSFFNVAISYKLKHYLFPSLVASVWVALMPPF